jgi:hypothetical protein
MMRRPKYRRPARGVGNAACQRGEGGGACGGTCSVDKRRQSLAKKAAANAQRGAAHEAAHGGGARALGVELFLVRDLLVRIHERRREQAANVEVGVRHREVAATQCVELGGEHDSRSITCCSITVEVQGCSDTYMRRSKK